MNKFEAVKELRFRLGLTQQALAEETGLAVHTVSTYETGKTATSDGVLWQFAKLADKHGYSDLVAIFTPGQPIRTEINVDEIIEMMAQVKEAEQKLSEAREKLERRLAQRGLTITGNSKKLPKRTDDPKDLYPQSEEEE